MRPLEYQILNYAEFTGYQNDQGRIGPLPKKGIQTIKLIIAP